MRPESVHPLADNLGSDLVGAPNDVNACVINGVALTYAGTADLLANRFPVCVIDSDIAADFTLTNDHVFVLDGMISIAAGATLTIPAGTQVFGAEGQNAGLHVASGGNLVVQGTADLPVIMGALELVEGPFTFGDATDLAGRGLWTGLHIEGMAMIDYMVVAESLDGVMLMNSSDDSMLDNVQVIGSAGDGIVVEGGAFAMRHIVVNGATDDGLDLRGGYTGMVQNLIVTIGGANGEHAIETNGAATAAMLANVTLLGNTGSATTRGALHNDGSTAHVYRAVYTDNIRVPAAFGDGCLDIDGELSADLMYQDVAFNCSPDNLAADDE